MAKQLDNLELFTEIFHIQWYGDDYYFTSPYQWFGGDANHEGKGPDNAGEKFANIMEFGTVMVLSAALSELVAAEAEFGATAESIAQARSQFSETMTQLKEAETEEEVLSLPQARFPKWVDKYEKHVIERTEWSKWGNLSKDAYYNRAIKLADSPIGGQIMGFTSKDGWMFRFNSHTGEFLTVHPTGYIETFYIPKNGMDYYLTQVYKYGN